MLPQVLNLPRRLTEFETQSRDGDLFSRTDTSRSMLPPQSPFRRPPGAPPVAPRQYGRPVYPHNADYFAADRDPDLGQLRAEQFHGNAEHMLRRKTPNGTLAAGYDGTPVHWSSKPSAPKHLILAARNSMQDANNSQIPMYGPGNRPSQYAEQGNWNRAGMDGTLSSPMGDSNPGGHHNSNSNWQFLPPPSGGSNMLPDKSPIHHGQPFFHHSGMQIPTVLQPAYQPFIGPTASNDAGVYGPYWPDGRFVPYRPAPFRNEGPSNHGSIPFLSLDNAPIQNQHNGNIYGNSLFGQQDSTRPNGPNEVQSRMTGLGGMSNPNSQPLLPCFGTDPASLPSLNGYTGPQAFPGPANVQFKDKVLARAHKAYVDLLALLHHSKKTQRDHYHKIPGSSSFANKGIYPKPPRQPASTLGESYTQSPSSGSPLEQSYNHSSGPLYRPRYFPSALVNLGQNHSATYHSSIANAEESLEILTSLCEESGWTWIDGLLLGGCLAYGLEDFSKAFDWYSKIIAIDPNHVEAISNLAATLLSLNRQEEAEQHWFRAVELRPSYFEAVEHLVGLLCGDHRGQEAIGIIELVERSLRIQSSDDTPGSSSHTQIKAGGLSIQTGGAMSGKASSSYHVGLTSFDQASGDHSGFGSSGYAIPGSDNGRILALVHAKGNMLYSLGDVNAASRAFEDAVLIAAGRRTQGIEGLIRKILGVVCKGDPGFPSRDILPNPMPASSPSLLPPDKALRTARQVFPPSGELPGLRFVAEGLARKAAVLTTSNSLLSLAKIFQDDMASTSQTRRPSKRPSSVADILALYYLSISLQPSPSTANNVGILLASIQQPVSQRNSASRDNSVPSLPGVEPGGGISLALAYYNYGLNLDSNHAHLYTNLGSLLKDIGQLTAAIKMYEKAVACDGTFDIALANLANAVKDQGRINDAIEYYRRAVASSPDFAEAVCGLANALNSVCDWMGRGGVLLEKGKYDRWHVDEKGMLLDGRFQGSSTGWMQRVVDIVGRQLQDGSNWGRWTLQLPNESLSAILKQIQLADTGSSWSQSRLSYIKDRLQAWTGKDWEGARVVHLIERAMKRTMRRWYQDKYVSNKQLPPSSYPRPQIPSSLSVPGAPTVLPFHTFTCPLTAKDVRMISQRNALRISCSTLKSPWLPSHVFPPPAPPNPYLKVGYVSSDFNNHPLSHLMQSVFGFHDTKRVKAICYATTASDNSVHRAQIEREAPVFHDASSWPADKLVKQIIDDGIHILVNLNGYTRGARNEVFAARPTPIQMSFMGFAGTLGAEWCDYLVADMDAIPEETLRPNRGNVSIEDALEDNQEGDWVYSENIVFTNDTFFCCDHAQSAPDSHLSWEDEQRARWAMRKELFPSLSDDAVILGNFNQLYKIDPTTFRTWLRILSRVPKAILWLLRFPDLGESNLKRTARMWAGEEVASRIWFTDVAPKHQHISRARVCDLFLDTPECNAHTTAADVLWSSTPLLTLPRYKYKMCSRMASSILKGALPKSSEGRKAALELIAGDDEQYEDFAVKLSQNLTYETRQAGHREGSGRLAELRKLLYENRRTSGLFDTRRWVRAVEDAYEEAWRRWIADEGGDIFL